MIGTEKPMRDTELHNSPSDEERGRNNANRFTVLENAQGVHGDSRSVIVTGQALPAVSRSSGGSDAIAGSNDESKFSRTKPVSRVEMIEKESASNAPSRWSNAEKSVISAILTLSSLVIRSLYRLRSCHIGF